MNFIFLDACFVSEPVKSRLNDNEKYTKMSLEKEGI